MKTNPAIAARQDFATPSPRAMANWFNRAFGTAMLLLALALSASAATPPCTTVSGLASWWTAEGNAVDVVGTNSGVLVNGAGFAAGAVGQAFSFDGNSQCVTIPYSKGLLASNFSVEAWVKPLGPVNNGLGQDLIIGQAYGGWQLVTRSGATGLNVAIQLANSAGSFRTVLGTNEIPIGQFSHLVATWNGSLLQLFINGTFNAALNVQGGFAGSSFPVYIGGFYIQQGSSVIYSDQYFNGLIDEPSYYNRALADSEVLALFNAGLAGKCTTQIPPTIQTQPLSRTVDAGTAATFSVLAAGTAPFTYQWHFNGVDISGATASALVLTNVLPANAGTYDVLVTNLYGATNSLAATLSVTTDPLIQRQPISLQVGQGSNATFSVTAAGGIPLSYQWHHDGAEIAGATRSSLVLTNVQLASAGTYDVLVTNLYGSTNSQAATLIVLGPPQLTSQPVSQQVFIGSNATFSVTATGLSPLRYQWHRNGANVFGATKSSLVISNAQLASAGTYDVTVTNRYGSTTSLGATLRVMGLPQIISQPADQKVIPGTNAIFSVTATGTPPLNYQWYFNGTPVAGQTTSTLAVNAVGTNDVGNYQVSVSNEVAVVLSRQAVLSLDTESVCVAPPAGLVSWWEGEADAADVLAINNGVLVNGTSFAAGKVGQAFSFDGNNRCVTVPYSASLVASNFTVETWVKPQGPINNWLGQNLIVGQAYGAWQLLTRRGSSGEYVALSIATSAGFRDVISTNQIPTNQFSHVVGTWDGTTLRLYINGALNGSEVPGASPIDSQYPVYIGGFCIQEGGSVSYSDQYFNGLIDEPSFYNRSLAAGEVQALYDAGSAGKCVTPMAPTIQNEPRSKTVTVGSTVMLSVEAAGSGPLRYQWHRNGANLTGATTTALVLTNVQIASAGTYDVTVTNQYGSTNSLGAILRVLSAPQITTQPADQKVIPGASATFSVTATGSEPLSYQWSLNGNPLAGQTASSLTIGAAGMNDVGYYQVSVSNEVGAAISRQAVLSLDSEGVCLAPPSGLVSWWAGEGDAADLVITNGGVLVNGTGFAAGKVGQAFSFNGSNQCVTVPYSASLAGAKFSVEAWVKPQAPVNNWLGQTLIMGQAYGAWQLVTRAGIGGQYVAIQFASGGSFESLVSTSSIPVGQFSHLVGTWDGATLRLYINGTLNKSIALASAPVNSQYPIYIGGFYIQQGSAVTYSDQYFTGLIDEPSYYNRALADNEVLTLFNAGSSGKCGTPMAPTIQTQPLSKTIATGMSVSLSVLAGGSGPLGYQWHRNGADIAGATQAALVLTNVQPINAGTYDVLVTNLYGATNSQGAILAVLTAPQITSEPQNQTVSPGTNVTFTVSATGDEQLSYQWYFNGAPLNDATNATLDLTAVSANQAGAYRVLVSNQIGSVYSRNALLFVQSGGSCEPAPAGLMSWWTADGNAMDAVGTNEGGLVNGTGFTVGEVGQAFSFNGSNQCVTVPYSASLVASNFTVEAWINPQASINNGLAQNLIMGQAYGAWQLVTRKGSAGQFVALSLGTSPVDFHELRSTNEIPLGQFTHVAGTWDGTTLRLFINGALNATLVPGVSPADSQYPVYIGGFYIKLGSVVSYSDQYFKGAIDEVSYYGRALSPAEVQTIYNAASAGKCGTGVQPAVGAQPMVKMASVDLNVPSPVCHIAVREDGSVRVSCSGVPGKTYLLQKRTSFLSQWTDLSEVKADASGICEYIDIPPASEPTRYYRALLR